MAPRGYAGGPALARRALAPARHAPMIHPVDVYRIMIACPNTGLATPTGVEVDELAAFDFVGLMPQQASCAHCPEVHVWTRRQAWLERRNASRVRMRAAAPAGPTPAR